MKDMTVCNKVSGNSFQDFEETCLRFVPILRKQIQLPGAKILFRLFDYSAISATTNTTNQEKKTMTMINQKMLSTARRINTSGARATLLLGSHPIPLHRPNNLLFITNVPRISSTAISPTNSPTNAIKQFSTLNHKVLTAHSTTTINNNNTDTHTSSTTSNTTNTTTTTVTTVVGESTGGKTFATYALTFVALHIMLAFGITSYLLFSEPDEQQTEAGKTAFRSVFLSRQTAIESEKLQGTELEQYKATGQFPEEIQGTINEKVEQMVNEQMASLEQAKLVGSFGMILTACISTCLTAYFLRKFVSKIVFHSPTSGGGGGSMDIYIQSWNPLVKAKPLTVQMFTRLSLVQANSKKPQVAFTPIIVDRETGESKPMPTLFYFSKDREDAMKVYGALNKSSFYQPTVLEQQQQQK